MHGIAERRPRPQPTPSLTLVVERAKRIIKAIPVDQLCKVEQLVFGIQDHLQRTAEQIIALSAMHASPAG